VIFCSYNAAPNATMRITKQTNGICRISRRKNSIAGRFLFLTASSLILTNILITSLLTTASIANYPGGQALTLFNHKYSQHLPPGACSMIAYNKNHSDLFDVLVHVHISNLAAQTGASLFLQIHAPPYPPISLFPSPSPSLSPGKWTYNKTESISLHSLASSASITHLISESKSFPKMEKAWRVAEGGSVEGFERWVVDWDLIKGGKGEVLSRVREVLKMMKEVKLWILERKGKS
jgi:alpha-1,6-mannosyltransferase